MSEFGWIMLEREMAKKSARKTALPKKKTSKAAAGKRKPVSARQKTAINGLKSLRKTIGTQVTSGASRVLEGAGAVGKKTVKRAGELAGALTEMLPRKAKSR